MRHNKKRFDMALDSSKRYADRLVAECVKDPERAALAILPLCERVCKTPLADMNSVLAKLHDMEDGLEISKISGADIGVSGDYARFMRDALVVPILLNTLSKQGLVLALSNDALQRPPGEPQHPSVVAMDAMKAREVMWEQADALEQQLEGFIAFQATTDMVSPYGQLIIKLATTVLAEIKIRKASKQVR